MPWRWNPFRFHRKVLVYSTMFQFPSLLVHPLPHCLLTQYGPDPIVSKPHYTSKTCLIYQCAPIPVWLQLSVLITAWQSQYFWRLKYPRCTFQPGIYYLLTLRPKTSVPTLFPMRDAAMKKMISYCLKPQATTIFSHSTLLLYRASNSLSK